MNKTVPVNKWGKCFPGEQCPSPHQSIIMIYMDLRSGYRYCSRMLGIPGSQCLTYLGTMKNLTVSKPTYVVMTDLFTYPALNNQRHPDAEPVKIFGKGSTAVKVYEIDPQRI